MSFTVFSICFVVLSAAMALWIDVRFPRLVPQDLRSAAVRLFVAFLVAQVAVPAVRHVAGVFPGVAEGAVVLAFGFAALILTMLAVVWILRLAHGMMGGTLR